MEGAQLAAAAPGTHPSGAPRPLKPAAPPPSLFGQGVPLLDALSRSGGACLLLSAALSASMAAVVKQVLLPAPEILLVRSCLSLAMSAAIAGSASGALGPQAMWPHLAIRGTLGALYVAAFFEAVKRLPLGDALVLRFTSPALTALVARVALGEHCGALGWLGCAASLAGVALIVQGHAGMLWLQAALHGERALLLQANATAAADEHALSTIGVCFGLASSFFAALSYVGLRLLSDAGGALVHSTWFFIAGAAVSGAALLGGVPLALPTPGAAALLVMLTAGLFMAQMLLNHGVGLVPAPQAASYGVTQVVWARCIDTLVFGTPLTPHKLVGMAAVLGGVLLVARDKPPPSPSRN